MLSLCLERQDSISLCSSVSLSTKDAVEGTLSLVNPVEMATGTQLRARRTQDAVDQQLEVGESPTDFMNGSAPGGRKVPAKDSAGLQHAPNDGEDDKGTTLAIAYTFLPSWFSTVSMLSLIFGGCCANVFALEAIIKSVPQSGTLITASQFVLTSLFTVSSHVNLYLRPRAIPLRTWLIYTAFFLTINILNNAAFGYKISVPLHIILRSAGPVATMVVGYFYGRRYTKIQVVAVFLLFLGVVQAAIADAQAKGAQISLLSTGKAEPGRSNWEFWTGFSILYLALMLSAIMGVFTDRTYAKYGRRHTQENLFYSHTLSLPFFLLRWPELQTQSAAIISSPSFSSYISAAGPETLPLIQVSWFHILMSRVPVQLVFLLMNASTQYLCIKGVNQLSARSSSLTVGIVLNIRKLVSLLLSIWLFGNKLAPGVLVGAVIVFIGGALYAFPASKGQDVSLRKENKKEL